MENRWFSRFLFENKSIGPYCDLCTYLDADFSFSFFLADDDVKEIFSRYNHGVTFRYLYVFHPFALRGITFLYRVYRAFFSDARFFHINIKRGTKQDLLHCVLLSVDYNPNKNKDAKTFRISICIQFSRRDSPMISVAFRPDFRRLPNKFAFPSLCKKVRLFVTWWWKNNLHIRDGAYALSSPRSVTKQWRTRSHPGL